jgi:hypothetical protein
MMEHWNIGIMGLGLRPLEDTGILGKRSIKSGIIDFKMNYIHLIPIIPIPHYSIIEADICVP